jgi:hypothetical protein
MKVLNFISTLSLFAIVAFHSHALLASDFNDAEASLTQEQEEYVLLIDHENQTENLASPAQALDAVSEGFHLVCHLGCSGGRKTCIRLIKICQKVKD